MAKNRKHQRVNPIARAPILRKGGEHTKSRSAERQQDKQKLKKLISKMGAGHSSPSDFMPSQAA